MTRIQKIPSETLRYKVVLRQSPPGLTNFTAAATSQVITLFGLPPKHVILGVRALLVTKFVAFGLSSCSVTVGATSSLDGTITTPNYYSPAFTCSQNASPTSFMFWSPFATYTTDPQDIKATFTSVGAQLGTLTAGEIEFSILYSPFF